MRDTPSGLRSFASELRRRRVFRVAAVYAAAAFAIAQVADIFFPGLGLPEWSLRLVLVLLILGFPVALVLAWAFDITPEGVMRTDAADAGPDVQEGGNAALPVTSTPAPVRAGRITVAGAVVILAGAGLAFALAGGRGETSDLSPNRVVVDAFVNRTGDPALDAAGHMAADWLVDGLQQISGLEVVPAVSLGTPALASAAPGAVAEGDRISMLAASTGAGLVVTGTYYLEGDALRFRAEITNAQRRRLLYTTQPVAAPRGSPSTALEPLRQEVMAYLASAFDWEATDEITGTTQVTVRPPAFELYRQFQVGQELFRQRNYREAIPHIDNVIARDSTFVLAIVLAALAYRSMGEYANVEPYVQLLERQRESLSPVGRAQADALRAQQDGDVVRALSALRRAIEISPTVIHYFWLGSYAAAFNRPREAIRAAGQIRSADFVATWLPHWTVLASAHHLLGEHERELEAVHAGQTYFADDLALRSAELRALAALGRTQEVLDRLDELFTLRGDVPTALHALALELTAHGHARAAAQVLERSVAWQRSRPASEAGTPNARFRLGRDLLELGQPAEARRIFQALVQEAPEELRYRAYRGIAAARAGDRAAAQEAMSWLATLERPYLFGEHLYQQAQIAAELGEREQAVALLRDAFARGRSFAPDPHRSPHLRSLRGYPPFEEMLRPKG